MINRFETGQTIGPNTGDFAGRDHETIVEMINPIAERFANALPDDEVDRRKRELMQNILNLEERTTGLWTRNQIAAISERYRKVSQGSQEEQLFRRVATVSDLTLVSDLDGTITHAPNPSSNYLIRQIPASSTGEALLTTFGREQFAEAFVRTWQPFLEEAPDLFRAGARDVPLRAGVPEFFSKWSARGVQLIILSANFEPFVQGVVKRVTNADVEIRAVTPYDITSTAKKEQLFDIAARRPNSAVVFIGDGNSDLPAIEASHALAGIFALEGGEFAKQLEVNHVAHLQYRDFNDIHAQLSRITSASNGSMVA